MSSQHSPIVSLTFDDGPHPIYTPCILDILRKYGIKAHFFVVGKNIDTYSGARLLKRMKDEGHHIGNHSYSHPNLANLSEQEVRLEVTRTHLLIKRIVGECSYFRPPYGSSNPCVQKIATELNYSELLWNVDTEDWKHGEGVDWVSFGFNQVESHLNSVILMHDSNKSTADNLERFICLLKQDGLVNFSESIASNSLKNLPTRKAVKTLPPLQDDWLRLQGQLELICSKLHSGTCPMVPPNLQEMLICAEDHRFMCHPGYDIRGITRAAYKTLSGHPQGGSTIAQQIARVLTGRYQRTIVRKIREIQLARLITNRFPKRDIPSFYLLLGYFGWRMNGLDQAYRQLGLSGTNLTNEQAANLVARLKYPEPRFLTKKRSHQISNRGAHILNLHSVYKTTKLLPNNFFVSHTK